MRMRTAGWLLAGLSITMGAQAQDGADDPGRQQLAAQMLQAMRGEQMIEQFANVFFQSMANGYRAQIASAGACPAAERVLDEQAGESRKLMLQAFKDGDYLNKIAQIYARTFTDAELRDAIGFFNSPTGQKFLEKQPELMQQGAVLGQSMMAAKQPELQALSTRLGSAMKTALEGCKPAQP